VGRVYPDAEHRQCLVEQVGMQDADADETLRQRRREAGVEGSGDQRTFPTRAQPRRLTGGE